MYVLLIECQVFALHANGIISPLRSCAKLPQSCSQDAVGELVSGSLDFTHGLMIRYGESWFWPKG